MERAKWRQLRAREVFADALVDVVKSGPACVGQLLPAGPGAAALLQDTAKLREFLGKRAEELDHQGAMGDALFRMEDCVKERLGPAGAALPTEGGGGTPGGPGSGAGGGQPPDFGGPAADHDTGAVLLDVHLFVADDTNLTYQGVGEFVVVKSAVDGLEIQVRQRPWAPQTARAC